MNLVPQKINKINEENEINGKLIVFKTIFLMISCE
jgi:hypothetical protein